MAWDDEFSAYALGGREQTTILFLEMPLMVTLYPEIDPVQRHRAVRATYGAFVGVIGLLMGLYAVLLASSFAPA